MRGSMSEAPAPPDVRRRPFRIFTTGALVALLAVVLLVLVAPPALFLIDVSLHEARPDGSMGAGTLQYYKQLWSDRFLLPSLANTAVYAVGSAIVAMTIGGAQALLVERTNAPGRRLVLFGAILSLGVPHVLYTVAWLLLMGRAGPVNEWITAATGSLQPFNVYSLWGMVLIEGFGFVPLTFLLMSSALRSTDAAFEEAAIMAGASPARTFWRISLRMALPAVCALLLLIFVRAFESFEVPALVGLAGNIDVMTTTIYQSSRTSGAANYGQAGAYSVCLVLIVIGLLAWQNRLSRHAHRYQSVTGKGFRPRVLDLRGWRYAVSGALFATFCVTTLLPVAILAFTSLQPFYEGVTGDSLQRFTFENYETLLAPGPFRDSIANTFILGVSTATFVVPFTALCAWLAARRAPGALWLDQLATLPLVFPAIIMGVAFLNVFVNLPIPLYGTLISVIIASSVRFLPYGMRYAYAGALQIHVDLEEAASISGASKAIVFLRVLAPLLVASLVSSWLLIFLLCVQTVSLPLLLVGPGTEIMAVTLFDLWQNGQVTELASMGIVWIALMTIVSTAFHLLTRRHQIT